MTRRAFPFALWAVLALLLVGCEIPAFLAQGIFGRTREARFVLPKEKKTLVLVDDPGEKLGPDMAAEVASHCGFHLKKNDAVTGLVSQKHLHDLRTELGAEFDETPVDLVGRRLGAAQVVYGRVTAVQREMAPGVSRPRARARVKVIDADEGELLFPDPTKTEQTEPRGRSVRVRAALPPETAAGDKPHQKRELMRELAGRLGKQMARLFHRHSVPPPADRPPKGKEF